MTHWQTRWTWGWRRVTLTVGRRDPGAGWGYTKVYYGRHDWHCLSFGNLLTLNVSPRGR